MVSNMSLVSAQHLVVDLDDRIGNRPQPGIGKGKDRANGHG